MTLDEFFNALKGFNGQAVTIRLDTVTLPCTFINAAKMGSADKQQVEVNVQIDDLQESQYMDLRKLLTQPVSFRIGNLDARVTLDAVSNLNTNPDQFQDDAAKPFTLTFSSGAQAPEDQATEHKEVGALTAELRAHGFEVFADRLERIHVETHQPGQQRMFHTIRALRTAGRHGLAEQLTGIAQEIYGSAPSKRDFRDLLRATLATQDLRGCNLDAALDAFHEALYKEGGPLSIPERTRGVLTIDETEGTPSPQRNP